MSDEIAVLGIECFAHHGVLEHEKREGQMFVIDLALGLDTAPAAASDDLRDTVDYGSLVTAVKTAVEREPVDLVETLAQRVADVCLLTTVLNGPGSRSTSRTPPSSATFSDVTLTITRRREDRRD